MKISFIPLVLAVFMFCSCSSKKRRVTEEGILTKDAMAAVLVDMHLLDATVFTYNSDTKSDVKLTQECYDSVLFSKYDCNDSIFKRSLEYYTLTGDIKEIYDNVLDSLNKQKVLLEQRKK
jgi:hypothetical protein